jgi:putative ABC transport system substrate-binding protein
VSQSPHVPHLLAPGSQTVCYGRSGSTFLGSWLSRTAFVRPDGSTEREGGVMNRRTFLAGTGAVLLAAPLGVEAQQPGKVYRIGWMIGSSVSASAHLIDAFRQGMRELGWVEGKNIEYEIRAAEGKLDRFPAIVAELLRLKVDLFLAPTNAAAAAAKNATSTVPIVFVVVSEAVERGLVHSLAQPGGNLTGLSLLTEDTLAKQLQILKEAIPRASRVSVLRWTAGRPQAPSVSPYEKELERAAQLLRIQLQVVVVQSPEEFDEAFSTMTRGRSDALIVMSNYLFFLHRTRLAELAVKSRLPGMFPVAEYAEAGGLMAYAQSFRDCHRRAAVYVDKILKGAKPADLPVEQPTKFELVINLKTAKALGLTIPPSLLGRADEVIQ